jgi:hypothetical protein
MPVIDRDYIANALTVSNYGQRRSFSKTMTSNTVANTYSTLWDSDGIPSAGGYTGSAYTAVQVTSATAGAFSFTDPTSPRNLFLLGGDVTSNTASNTGTLIVLDRLLYYPGINHATTGTTAMTNGVSLPRSTTGAGVMAFLEVTTGLNATAHTVQLTYTDSANNSGNVTTAITPIASSAARRIPYAGLYFPLASGDVGVRSVQNVIVTGAGATGTSAVVLAKEICRIPMTSTGVVNKIDLLKEELDLPEIEDGAALMFILVTPAAATTPNVNGKFRAVELAVS